MIRLAHISDLHLTRPLCWSRVNCKQLLGHINWLCNRRFKHHQELLGVRIRAIIEQAPDLVLLTGDLTQAGQESELELAAELLAPLTNNNIPVLLTSGNHDHYHPTPQFAATMKAIDKALRLGVVIDDCGVAQFNEARIIIMNQARSTPPFTAWGEVGAPLMDGLRRRLASEHTAGPRIAVGHYPIHNPCGALLPRAYGLRDAPELLELFHQCNVSAYYCGHLHQAFERELFPGCRQYCAGSATIKQREGNYLHAVG